MDTILAIGWQAIKLAEEDEKVLLGRLRAPQVETGADVSLERARWIAKEDPQLIYAYRRLERRLPGQPKFDIGGEG
jgi:hypothetical protein